MVKITYNPEHMKVFLHSLYEYRKGVRNMALCTMPAIAESIVKKRLSGFGIDCIVQKVNVGKINIFFGNDDCLAVVKKFADKPLNMLTPEEDFILGILLGYSIPGQCARYCQRKQMTSCA